MTQITLLKGAFGALGIMPVCFPASFKSDDQCSACVYMLTTKLFTVRITVMWSKSGIDLYICLMSKALPLCRLLNKYYQTTRRCRISNVLFLLCSALFCFLISVFVFPVFLLPAVFLSEGFLFSSVDQDLSQVLAGSSHYATKSFLFCFELCFILAISASKSRLDTPE